MFKPFVVLSDNANRSLPAQIVAGGIDSSVLGDRELNNEKLTGRRAEHDCSIN